MNITALLFILFVAILVIVAADFDAFAKKFGKKYANANERSKREKKYVENLKRIDALNAKVKKHKSNAVFDANKFADLDPAEFSAMYLGVIPENGVSRHRGLAAKPIGEDATTTGKTTTTKSTLTTTKKTTTTKTTTTKTTTTKTTTSTTTKTTTTKTTTTKTTTSTTTKTTTTKTTTTKTTTTKTTTRTTTKTTTTKTTTTKTTTRTTTKTTTTKTTTRTTTKTTTTKTTTPTTTKTTTTKTTTSTTTKSITNLFDWTTQTGIVAPVKNQGGCGSCWAFAATGVLESYNARQGNALTLYSEQLLVDCNTYVLNYPGGCSGNYLFAPFNFFKANGTEQGSDYPYVGVDSSCKYNPSKVVLKINSYGYTSDESQYADLLRTYGPMAIHINGNALQWYWGGILSLDTCDGQPINHAVILVGYGTENGVNYWRIKNSWGTSWGESGFVRVKRGENACGVANGNAYYIIS